MNRRRRIYEGKAKILYEGPEPGTLIQHFKDDATAFNAEKHALFEGKGVLNNRISELMRSFERSDWFSEPSLSNVSAADKSRAGYSQFNLSVMQKTPEPQGEDAK